MADIRLLKQQLNEELKRLPSPVQEHGKRCRMIAIYLVDQIRREDWFIEERHNPDAIVSAVYFHDLGKAEIPLDNLYAEHCRSGKKQAVYRTHVEKGVEILEAKTGIAAATFPKRSFGHCLYHAIIEHHECADGRGFPAGISGRKMSLTGKIAAIADTLDHLAFVGLVGDVDTDQTIAALESMAGAELDEQLVRALLADGEKFSHFLEYVQDHSTGQKSRRADEYGLCFRYTGIYHLQENRRADYYCEYLLNDPYYGLLRPEVFLRVAEKSTQILKLTKLAIRHLCLTVDAVTDNSGEAPFMSLPVSSVCLEHASFVPDACKLLKTYGIKRGSICLVLDEYTVIQDPDVFRKAVVALRDGGYRVGVRCMGDTSTLLSVLDTLPLDALYVEGRYTAKIVRDPNAYGVASGLLDMAENLHMRLVFMGVDDRKIESELLRMTARYGTGTLYGEPLRERDLLTGEGGDAS